MALTNFGIPAPSYAFVGGDGKVNPVWYQFLSVLWQRSGAAPGNDHSVTVKSSNGILSNVDNPDTNAVINLSLGGITPTSVTTSGAIIGNSGSFAVGLSTGGVLQFGAYVNTPLTSAGYITVNDATGNSRKLMVGI